MQHVSLSCLVCNTLVYRVAHTIHPGEEAREGPVVPSAEWAEEDVLRSSTGLVDVSSHCLVRIPRSYAISSPTAHLRRETRSAGRASPSASRTRLPSS